MGSQGTLTRGTNPHLAPCGDGGLTLSHCWQLQPITTSFLLGADGRWPRFMPTWAPAGLAPHFLVAGGWFSGYPFFPLQIEFVSWLSLSSCELGHYT